MLKSIEIRVMTHPKRLLLLTGERGELFTNLEILTSCGWFVTKIKTETFKVSLMNSLDYKEYTLRSDDVPENCVLAGAGNACTSCTQRIF